MRISMLACCAAGVLLLTGCAGESRLLRPSASDSKATLNLGAVAADGVRVTLHQVIVRNDPASWVRDAEWDEYRLSIRNDATVPLELRSIELSNELLGSVKHNVSPNELKSQTTRNIEIMKSAGRIVVIGYTGGLTAALAISGAMGYAWAISPLLPIALVAGGVTAYRSQSQANEEAKVIEYEMGRRGFRLPEQLLPGTELQNSAFFPVTPAPDPLRLRYVLAGQEKELVLALPALAQLHIKPAQK